MERLNLRRNQGHRSSSSLRARLPGAVLALLLGACTSSDTPPAPDGGMSNPDGASGGCVACGAGQVCVAGTCMNVPSGCPCPKETYCDLASNTCKVGCTMDPECSTGRICNTGTRQCFTGCRKDKDCAAGQQCDVGSATCKTPQGSGTFTAAAGAMFGGAPYGLAALDFDGDGKLDLAGAFISQNVVAWLRGDGKGAFGDPTAPVSTGTSPYSLATADFNGDRRPDLVAANNGSASVSVILNSGAGFAAARNFTVGSQPTAAVPADLDGDGKQDLVVGYLGQSFITILRGDGAGGFTSVGNVTTESSPRAIAVADFNGDGSLDVAVTATGTSNVDVLLNNGAGQLGAYKAIPLGPSPRAIVAADLDNDGKIDLAVASSTEPKLYIVRGDGKGGFTPPTTPLSMKTGSFALLAGRFSTDPRPMLIATNGAEFAVFPSSAAGFGAPTYYPGAGSMRALTAGDWNGDVKLDFAGGGDGDAKAAVLLNQ